MNPKTEAYLRRRGVSERVLDVMREGREVRITAAVVESWLRTAFESGQRCALPPPVLEGKAAYELRVSPIRQTDLEIIAPNGGILATVWDGAEPLATWGPVAARTILATLNGGVHQLLVQAADRLTREAADKDDALDQIGDLNSELRQLKPFRDNAVAYQAIVADALLWFDGFAAAHSPRESWERPHLPDRERLRDLNAAFQRVLPPGPDADQEIPF